jgi:hypothetical protein
VKARISLSPAPAQSAATGSGQRRPRAARAGEESAAGLKSSRWAVVGTPVTIPEIFADARLKRKQGPEMAFERSQVFWFQGPDALSNPSAINRAKLECQDDGSHLQAIGSGGLYFKGTRIPAGTRIRRQGDNEDGGQRPGGIGLDDDRRSPTGLFPGNAGREFDPMDLSTP